MAARETTSKESNGPPAGGAFAFWSAGIFTADVVTNMCSDLGITPQARLDTAAETLDGAAGMILEPDAHAAPVGEQKKWAGQVATAARELDSLLRSPSAPRYARALDHLELAAETAHVVARRPPDAFKDEIERAAAVLRFTRIEVPARRLVKAAEGPAFYEALRVVPNALELLIAAADALRGRKARGGRRPGGAWASFVNQATLAYSQVIGQPPEWRPSRATGKDDGAVLGQASRFILTAARIVAEDPRGKALGLVPPTLHAVDHRIRAPRK